MSNCTQDEVHWHEPVRYAVRMHEGESLYDGHGLY